MAGCTLPGSEDCLDMSDLGQQRAEKFEQLVKYLVNRIEWIWADLDSRHSVWFSFIGRVWTCSAR